MRYIIILLILIIFSGCATLGTSTLIGKVVDAKSGNGVEGVEIKVIDKAGQQVTIIKTQDKGEFTISALKKDEYKFICYKEDVSDTKEKVINLKKLSKEESKSLTIPLILWCAVEGRIISGATNEPVSQATIRFLTEDNSPITKEWSEPTGKFLFRNLPVEKGKFRIEHPNFIWAETTGISLEPGRKLVLTNDIKLTPIPEQDWINPTGEYEIIKIEAQESGVVDSNL